MILDNNGVEFPVPESQVIEAQAVAQTFNAELAEKRMILDMDKLASLVSPNVTLEQAFTQHMAYFFTINGVLNGSKISGAMFAAECILVFAGSEKQAYDVARRGLRDTVEAAHEWYELYGREREEKITTLATQGTLVDSGGRRLTGDRPLERTQQAKMHAMIRSVFGNQPFKF